METTKIPDPRDRSISVVDSPYLNKKSVMSVVGGVGSVVVPPIDALQTADDDVLVRTVDRLRSIAAKKKVGGDYSNEDYESSMDSTRQISSRAEPKPTFPTYAVDAKPKTKFVFRKYTPQVYSILPAPHNNTTSSSLYDNSRASRKDGDDVDAVIDIRSRTYSGTLYYPDESKDSASTSAKMIKRRSSEKSQPGDPDYNSSGNNKGSSSMLTPTTTSLFNNRTIRCPHCSAVYSGFTAVDVVEEHQVTCKIAMDLKDRFQLFDSSLRSVSSPTFLQFCFTHLDYYFFYRE